MEHSGMDHDNNLEEGELGAPAKKQPISLEELLERKAQKEKEESRPVFLSKEERAKVAIEKRKKVNDNKYTSLACRLTYICIVVNF